MDIYKFYKDLRNLVDPYKQLERQNLYSNEIFQSYLLSKVNFFDHWFFWETNKLIELYLSNNNKSLAHEIILLKNHALLAKTIFEKEKLYQSYTVDISRLENLSELDILLFLTGERKRISQTYREFSRIFPDKDLIFKSFYDEHGREQKRVDLHTIFSLTAKDMQAMFCPVNPICLCTAIALTLVLKYDYNDFLKRYIFSKDVEWESLIELPFSGDDIEILNILTKERNLIDALPDLSLRLMQINGAKTDKIPTIWHRRWTAWIAINPNYVTDNELILTNLHTTLYSHSHKINDRVHNFREQIEYEINDNKQRLNDILASKIDADLDKLLEKQELLELNNQKARDLYLHLPHELGAHQAEVDIVLVGFLSLPDEKFSELSLNKRKQINQTHKNNQEYLGKINNMTEKELAQNMRNSLLNDLQKEALSKEDLLKIGFDLKKVPFLLYEED